MSEDEAGSRPVTFEFRVEYARSLYALVALTLAAFVYFTPEAVSRLRAAGSLAAARAAGDPSDTVTSWIVAGGFTLFGAVIALYAGRRQRLSIDAETFRWDGPGAFAVPVASIRRLSVFGDDLSYALYTIESRTHGTSSFQVMSKGVRDRIKPFLDEVELRTGLKWVGMSEAGRSADRRRFLDVLRASAGLKGNRQLARWFVSRSLFLRIGELGLNDPLVRVGYNVFEQGRIVWTLPLFWALAMLNMHYPVPLYFIVLVFAAVAGIWVHSSLGVNIMLTLMQGEIRRRERLEQELDTARSVQERLAPQKTPPIAGFDIAGTCTPAREVGGDYYDYIPVGDGDLVVAVADVSGKGLGPGLLMTLTKGALTSSLYAAPSLPSALGQVNGAIRGAVAQHMFVSMALARLSSRDRQVMIARAGHNPPMVVRNDGSVEWISPPGVALGLASGRVFEKACGVEAVVLDEGDVLLLYTDGLTEAMSPLAEEFGEERFAASASRARKLGASSMRDALLRDVDEHRANAEVNDDLTLVVIKAA